ncbi:MAG TPA: hypothetical protein PKH32_10205 [Verrucomicrobiota bacterium]|nr:hypothetical protein [Verrucomicrobiota bacterium]
MRFFAAEARVRSARTAIAVERYRRAHEESLPPALTNLVPEFLGEVPLDPFDGQPLRFVTTPKGFIVYSIGPDGVDNGGAERVDWSMRSGFDERFVVER